MTQQPTIPAEDGEVEKVLKYLVDNVELIRHRVELRHLKPADGFNHNERLKAEALAALKAREQRIALESRIDELDSLDHNKQMFGDWQQVIEDRRAALTSQLSQLTQYNQSEGSVEDE